jgi:hypothetical protein
MDPVSAAVLGTVGAVSFVVAAPIAANAALAAAGFGSAGVAAGKPFSSIAKRILLLPIMSDHTD